VCDGSVVPRSLGVNPLLRIHGSGASTRLPRVHAGERLTKSA
jgi:hypothetical protein